MPYTGLAIHTLVVVSLLVIILARPTWGSNTTYMSVFGILLVQLYFVFAQFRLETFVDTPATDATVTTVPTEDNASTTLHSINTASMSKLINIPSKIQKDITGGMDDLLHTMKGKEDKVAMLMSQNKRYANQNVRKQYKHIDYLLEKVKIFNNAVYDALVPEYPKEAYDKMREEDNNAMSSDVKPQSCPEDDDANPI